MTKSQRLLNAAKILRENCQKIDVACTGCIFNKHDPDALFFKGCLLNDPDHLPETWNLEIIESEEENDSQGD